MQYFFFHQNLEMDILDDLNYIILDDLIKMNFTKLEITKFKNINPNLS